MIFCSGAKHLEGKFKRIKGVEIGESITEFFPDSELRERFSKKLNLRNKNVFLVQSFFSDKDFGINDRIFEVLTAYQNAKSLGAKKIYLIAPYFSYLREDKRFEKNEAISARVMAWLFSCFNKVFIFEPHLHRLKKFSDFFPNAKRISLHEFFIKEIKKLHAREECILVGPDDESEQWAKVISNSMGGKCLILEKKRLSPSRVIVKMEEKIGTKSVVIIDDIISTGGTLLETCRKIKGKQIYCFGYHGLFVDDKNFNALKKIAKLYSTNTVRVDRKGVKIIDISDKIKEIMNTFHSLHVRKGHQVMIRNFIKK